MLDTSHSIAGKIHKNQEICIKIETDLPTSQSSATDSSSDSDDDERNIDHQEDSIIGGIIILRKVRCWKCFSKYLLAKFFVCLLSFKFFSQRESHSRRYILMLNIWEESQFSPF